MTDHNMFMIVGEQRSGTMMLGDLLSSHPNVWVSSEVFLNFPSDYDSYFAFLADRAKTRPFCIYPQYETIVENIVDFFDSLRTKAKYEKPNCKKVGIHIKYDQFDYVVALRGILNELRLSIVHIIRRNCLATIMSQHLLRVRIAARLNAHSKFNASEANLKVRLPNADSVLIEVGRLMERINKHRISLPESGPYIETYYEDLASDARANELSRIQEFLNIPTLSLVSTIGKSSPPDLRSVIENIDEYERLVKLAQGASYQLL